MIIALDIEGTLVSNAVSRIPRPGLRTFLEACADLATEVVIFTSVSERRFRQLAEDMVSRGEAPEWFPRATFVQWQGPYKRISFIPGAEDDSAALVDDMEPLVHPDDREHWIAVPPFEPPGSHPAAERGSLQNESGPDLVQCDATALPPRELAVPESGDDLGADGTSDDPGSQKWVGEACPGAPGHQ